MLVSTGLFGDDSVGRQQHMTAVLVCLGPSQQIVDQVDRFDTITGVAEVPIESDLVFIVNKLITKVQHHCV